MTTTLNIKKPIHKFISRSVITEAKLKPLSHEKDVKEVPIPENQELKNLKDTLNKISEREEQSVSGLLQKKHLQDEIANYDDYSKQPKTKTATASVEEPVFIKEDKGKAKVRFEPEPSSSSLSLDPSSSNTGSMHESTTSEQSEDISSSYDDVSKRISNIRLGASAILEATARACDNHGINIQRTEEADRRIDSIYNRLETFIRSQSPGRFALYSSIGISALAIAYYVFRYGQFPLSSLFRNSLPSVPVNVHLTFPNIPIQVPTTTNLPINVPQNIPELPFNIPSGGWILTAIGAAVMVLKFLKK